VTKGRTLAKQSLLANSKVSTQSTAGSCEFTAKDLLPSTAQSGVNLTVRWLGFARSTLKS
jgi:hypothetical protein